MANKEELINCFKDTINIINTNRDLMLSTRSIMNDTFIYNSDISVSLKNNNAKANITVVENTTFNAAKAYVHQGQRVAVLNFASAVNPGGGVTIGAMAQEECLCRSSNLLPCLKQKRLMKEYYMPHRIENNPMYSDKVIYTKGVTVFKTDEDLPQLMPDTEWFKVDVITCAAPNLRNLENVNKKELHKVLSKRITVVLNCAIQNQVDTIVLGAWGCGAFKNPPEIVADAFKEVIHKNYQYAFKNIVFAIKKSNNDNFNVFKSLLNNEKNAVEIDNEEFAHWRENNKYYGKTFSILGDSISTLDGYIPNGYKAFFEGEVCEASGVNTPEDTWWGKVISFFGGKLLVNNSYSGSRTTSSNNTFPAGLSQKRIHDLSKNGISPDVIIIYMGFNDWADGADLKQHDDGAQVLMNSSYFSDAYYGLIYEIKDKYPDAEIICCTLNTTCMSAKPDFSFPFEKSGIHIEEYNKIIRSNSEAWECKLADLYSYHKPNDTIDGTHPNLKGMNTLAALICHSVSDNNGKQFIDIENCKLPDHNEKLEIFEISDTKEQKKFCHICGVQLDMNDKFCMQCGTKVITGDQNSDIKEEISSEEKASETEEIIDNRYSLLRKIGKGASSVVYLAQDTRINRICAVKMVKKNTYENTVAAQASLDEANKLKLLAHISIPQLYDIIDEEDSLSIVMEYLAGKNLAEIIKESNKPLNEATLVNWSKQLCNVLYYLHTLNPPRIYRDLKPNNIILQPNGIIKLVDFGTMKNYDESCAEDIVNLGTKGYAAPEQFGGRGQTDVRTDIYGLGMTLYHLTTGVNPTITPFEFKPVCFYRSDISKGFESIIIKCIEVERENRYQSVSEILKDLMKLQSD